MIQLAIMNSLLTTSWLWHKLSIVKKILSCLRLNKLSQALLWLWHASIWWLRLCISHQTIFCTHHESTFPRGLRFVIIIPNQIYDHCFLSNLFHLWVVAVRPSSLTHKLISRLLRRLKHIRSSYLSLLIAYTSLWHHDLCSVRWHW